MYCTPWARLMKSITPNTSVSPAATRNSRTPSCSPLKHWTTNRAVDMGDPGSDPSRRRRRARANDGGEGSDPVSLLQLAVFGVAVALALENLLHDLGLELAVGALGHLHEIEVLHREAVGVELEWSAHRLEVGLFEGGPQR